MLHLSVWLSTLAQTASERVRSAQRARGASLLEYVLLAAVVLAVVAAFGYFFKDSVTGLIERITGKIDETENISLNGFFGV